ncbi:MAG: zinc ribbon domain-containing protein [Chloroflexia bacterium]
MTNFMDSLRRGLDRAGFEADKLMRYNRVRAEASRMHSQVGEQTRLLGEMAVALYKAGTLTPPELVERAREIIELQTRAQQKEDESNTIQAESWVEPPDAGPQQGGQHSISSMPPPAYNPPAYNPPPYNSPAPPPAAPTVQPPLHLEDQGTHRVPDPTRTEYCPNCGAPLRPNAAFCAQCGIGV